MSQTQIFGKQKTQVGNTVFAWALVSTYTSTILLLLHIYIICVSIYIHAHSVDVFPYSHIHKTVDDTSPDKTCYFNTSSEKC